MTTNACASCQNPKGLLQCSVCADPVCKSCARFVSGEDFQYLRELPADLIEHSSYCPGCYESKVGPFRDAYEDALEKARDVNVFYRTQGKESRFIRRTEKPLKVENCADKDEVIMRLAFLAAQAGFNVLVDVDLSSEKVRNGGWQTSNWSGSAVPAKVDPAKLNRRFNSSPN